MQALLQTLASLRLTVTLLALTMVLVFAGTWAQIDHGIWQVQAEYFHSFFCWVPFQLFWKRPLPGHAALSGGFPMIGGYTIIALLLLNLLSAHYLRFKFNRKRFGVLLLHAGLILLLVGEVVTSVFARESRMMIEVGQTTNFTQDIRKPELAIIDPSDPSFDQVVAISGKLLTRRAADHRPVSGVPLPFQLRINAYYPNSNVVGPFQLQQMLAEGRELPRATAGEGTKIGVVGVPPVNGTSESIDSPSAYITPIVDGKSLDTYLVSTLPLEASVNGVAAPAIDQPQPIVVNGKTYLLHLRWKREYKPYSLTLKNFSHDTYQGTTLDSNFASVVRLKDSTRNEDRDVRIWMNHPLRYAGETFYQASFREGDRTTILQVVRNPGWLIPYVSCILVGLGMIVHFGGVLISFLRKQKLRTIAARDAAVVSLNSFEPGRKYLLKPDAGGFVWPAVSIAIALLYFSMSARAPGFAGPFDLNAFTRVPVNFDGRVMPLDTLAKNSLRILSGKATLTIDGVAGAQPAIRWLADVFADHETARKVRVIRIDNPDLLGALDLDRNRHMFSFDEVLAKQDALVAQLKKIQQLDEKQYDPYQHALAELNKHLGLIDRLSSIMSLLLVPPDDATGKWTTFEESMKASQDGKLSASSSSMGAMNNLATALSSYTQKNAGEFNRSIRNYLADLPLSLPAINSKVQAEATFNQADPFINCMAMYVLVLVLASLSWLIAPARATLRRSAFAVLVLTMLVHTIALGVRMYIQGRPPVTNLYSSAIFIAWAAAVFCVGLEIIYRNGVGSLAAACIAFPSLLIAHYLAESGDTMGMLRAVLDTNIWLATHVVVITLGYTATFLAGIIGIVFVVGRLIGAFDVDETRKNVSRMIYGVVCFAMLFSFVGTVLGGIWADQSWGRFWGWDPKENGAVLIVLWNAIVLHARWSGLVKERGVANLAIFGNIVTAWSWFGTNMLGVGLHSYGFIDSAVFWLSIFMGSQLLCIAIGLIPIRRTKPISMTSSAARTATRLKTVRAHEPQS